MRQLDKHKDNIHEYDIVIPDPHSFSLQTARLNVHSKHCKYTNYKLTRVHVELNQYLK